MKDLKWLKEEVSKINDTAKNKLSRDTLKYIEGVFDGTGDVLKLINQVEQPEITTKQAWEVIKGKYGEETLSNNIDYVKAKGYEIIGKPTIPQSVDVRINEYKEDKTYDIRTMFNRGYRKISNLQADEADFWIDDNKEDFAMAIIIGYTVEEKKYRVKSGNIALLGKIDGMISTTVEILEHYPEYTPTYQLTEQEIKEFDEKYMAFAIPVEREEGEK